MYSIPLIDMENPHAKQNHQPSDDGDDDYSHNHSHLLISHGRQDLSPDHAVDHAVSQHNDEIQETCNLARVVTHKVPSNDLSIISDIFRGFP